MNQPTTRPRRPDLYDGEANPCERCRPIAEASSIFGDPSRIEWVQPVPVAPALARDGSGPCCQDCASADTLHQRFMQGMAGPAVAHRVGKAVSIMPFTDPTCEEAESQGMTWAMCRVAVGTDRQEQLRMPGMPMGLCYDGTVALSEDGDLKLHLAWMDRHGVHPPKWPRPCTSYEPTLRYRSGTCDNCRHHRTAHTPEAHDA